MSAIGGVPALPRYLPNTSKIAEVILWLANSKPGIDVYHVVKCAFFADKFHLRAHGRPVTGDVYYAAPYGPLGRSLYGLLRGEPIDSLALETNGQLPFRVEQGNWTVTALRDCNTDLLSRSDVEALQHAVDMAGDLSFEELVELTHDESAYIKANGGMMSYAELLDGLPDRSARARDLLETASQTVL